MLEAAKPCEVHTARLISKLPPDQRRALRATVVEMLAMNATATPKKKRQALSKRPSIRK